jgi:hypothetical protein
MSVRYKECLLYFTTCVGRIYGRQRATLLCITPLCVRSRTYTSSGISVSKNKLGSNWLRYLYFVVLQLLLRTVSADASSHVCCSSQSPRIPDSACRWVRLAVLVSAFGLLTVYSYMLQMRFAGKWDASNHREMHRQKCTSLQYVYSTNSLNTT